MSCDLINLTGCTKGFLNRALKTLQGGQNRTKTGAAIESTFALGSAPWALTQIAQLGNLDWMKIKNTQECSNSLEAGHGARRIRKGSAIMLPSSSQQKIKLGKRMKEDSFPPRRRVQEWFRLWARYQMDHTDGRGLNKSTTPSKSPTLELLKFRGAISFQN